MKKEKESINEKNVEKKRERIINVDIMILKFIFDWVIIIKTI